MDYLEGKIKNRDEIEVPKLLQEIEGRDFMIEELKGEIKKLRGELKQKSQNLKIKKIENYDLRNSYRSLETEFELI